LRLRVREEVEVESERGEFCHTGEPQSFMFLSVFTIFSTARARREHPPVSNFVTHHPLCQRHPFGAKGDFF